MSQDIPSRALDWLVQNRRLSRKALDRCQQQGLKDGRPVEQVLVESGELDRPSYLGAASEVAGVPPFNLQAQKISYSRAQMLSRQVVEGIPALPVGLEDGHLVVVMGDPTDTFALERLATLTHMPVAPRVTYNPDFPAAIEKAFAVKVERITAETPHGGGTEASSESRQPMKFATATRTRELDQRLRQSVVQTMGTSRSVKIEGFITARPKGGDDRLETPEERLEFLTRNLIRLTEPADARQRVATLLETARTLCRSDAASILLLSDDRTELYFAQAVGARAEEMLSIRLPLNEQSVAGFSVLNRQTIRVNDAAIDPRQSKETDAKIGYRTRSLIAAPVSWEGEPLGVLEVVNKVDGSFDDQDVEVMQVLAAQAAVALLLSDLAQQARAFRREAAEVFQDLLERTGLQTREHGQLVARVAVALGEEVRLSPQELERLRLAALVHEIDRLGGREGAGVDLLARLQVLEDVAPVVRFHRAPHEGPDGTRGGSEIPRLSRILALAVAWIEGLERLGLQRRGEVLREILAACGSRFDPALKIPFEIAVNAVTPQV